MAHIKESDAERIVMDDLDALFLRNETVDDMQERPGKSTGCGVWRDAQGSRGNGGERSDVPRPRNEQALPGGVPREDPSALARYARPGGDRTVRRQGRPLRRQASLRIQRPERCP